MATVIDSAPSGTYASSNAASLEAVMTSIWLLTAACGRFGDIVIPGRGAYGGDEFVEGRTPLLLFSDGRKAGCYDSFEESHKI